MSLLKLLFLLLIFRSVVYSQCHDCYVDVYEGVNRSGETEFEFVSYDFEYTYNYVQFLIEVRNTKGDIIISYQYKPIEKETRYFGAIVLPRGRYRIIMYDYKKNMLAVSDEFEVK